jgi:TatD DNase family protein
VTAFPGGCSLYGRFIRWTDNHCHLPEAVDQAGPVVLDAVAGGVERLVTVGCDVAQSAAYVAVARAHPSHVWATAGVHPHDAKDGAEGLEELVRAGGVVAVGECGLDFHYDHSPREAQRAVFAAQIALARAVSLPLVVHTREAWAETFDILEVEGVPATVVFHCFTGGPDEARRCLDAGGHLSFSGIVTFPSADDVRAAAALCPLDRVLVETDSPYLAPIPHRGKRNQPAWVSVVGEAVAALRGIASEEVASATWATAERVYRLM